jgi:hypothetical protein
MKPLFVDGIRLDDPYTFVRHAIHIGLGGITGEINCTV